MEAEMMIDGGGGRVGGRDVRRMARVLKFGMEDVARLSFSKVAELVLNAAKEYPAFCGGIG
jgi:hypothetical protein